MSTQAAMVEDAGRRCFLRNGLWVTVGALLGFPAIVRARIMPSARRIATPTPSVSSQTFLVDEGFEGTGLPASWADDSTGGTRDFDYTTTALDGSQSLYYQDPGASNNVIIRSLTFTGQDEIYFTFRIQEVTGHIPAGVNIISVENGSNTILGSIARSGGSGLLKAVPAGSAGGSTAAVALSTTLWRKIKGRYKKGTGANSEMELWVAASGDAGWGTPQGATNGTATTQAVKVRFFFPASSTSNAAIVDKVRVSTTDIAIGDA